MTSAPYLRYDPSVPHLSSWKTSWLLVLPPAQSCSAQRLERSQVEEVPPCSIRCGDWEQIPSGPAPLLVSLAVSGSHGLSFLRCTVPNAILYHASSMHLLQGTAWVYHVQRDPRICCDQPGKRLKS